MRFVASFLQLAGMVSVIVGGVLASGVAGGCVAGGLSALFVGVAFDRQA